MALMLSNLFDKKGCAICGATLGVMGNTKLADGVICKDCVRKLSPHYTVRKSDTVQFIVDQQAYREKNKEDVAAFHATRTMGEHTRVLIDTDRQWVIVTSAPSILSANPDVIRYDQIVGCEMEVREDKDEQKKENEEKKMVSYDPPRYSYEYDFYVTLYVNHPYFDRIRFQVNNASVKMEDKISRRVVPRSDVVAKPGGPRPSVIQETPSKPDPLESADYCRYQNMTQEIQAALQNIHDLGTPDGPKPDPVPPITPTPAPAPTTTVTTVTTVTTTTVAEPAAAPIQCPFCGTVNTPGHTVCTFCGGSLTGR